MRRIVFLAILALSVVLGAHAQTPNTISTVVGGGTNTGAATGAFLPGPSGVVRDTLGNTYVSAAGLNIVYKITSGGTISAFAGNGIAGFSGDESSAVNAELNNPLGLALDSSNHLFIADSNNNRIRMVDGSGTIHTFAGSGNQYNGVGFFGGYSGDGGPATSALMNVPVAITFDVNGNLFIVDANNNAIRMVDTSLQHTITTYAGGAAAVCTGATDTLGDGCPATQAFLGAPQGVAVHSSGDLYIADSGNSLIRKVDNTANHIITVYGGNINGTACPTQTDAVGDGCPATQAILNFPIGIFVDAAENVLIGDTNDARVRKITHSTQIITTIAGNGSVCLNLTTAPANCGDTGLATSALLNQPSATFQDGSGNLLITDFGTNRLRIVSAGASPSITTFAGGGTGGEGVLGTTVILPGPFTLATDSSGDVFIAESEGNRIRRWDASAKTVTTYVGNGIQGVIGQPNGDGGLATQANVVAPLGIVLDAGGNLFFADGLAHVVRTVDQATKHIAPFAGTGAQCNTNTVPGCGDGALAINATFKRPFGVAVDSHGNVYISDSRGQRIRVVNAVTKNISNFAGTGVACTWTVAVPCGDGGPASSASFNFPQGLAFDSQDNLYVADPVNNIIRKIDNTPAHNVTTYAFNGQPTFGGDGGAAASASMQFPEQVAVDANRNLLVGGGIDNVVRRIDVNDQTVITVAGDVHNLDGGFRASDDGGPSNKALLSNFGVAIDANKHMYIADSGNARIRVVPLAPVVSVLPTSFTNFGPVLIGAQGPNQPIDIFNNGLDDLILTNITVPTGFTTLNTCVNPITGAAIVAPSQSCALLITFAPPVGIAAGTVSGNLHFNTNDSTNPSFNLALSGTAVGGAGFLLTVNENGTGTGNVGSTPGGISCPATGCSASFAPGQQVTLFASPQPGSSFTGWTIVGSTSTCPATNACTVTIGTTPVTVTATFGSVTVKVSGFGNGNGIITDNLVPPLINCTYAGGTNLGNCVATYPQGISSVVFTATPSAAAGSSFAGWLGFCGITGLNSSGTGPCSMNLSLASLPTVNGAIATAVFSAPPLPFTAGQIFLGSLDGMIFVYNPNGNMSQVLNSGNLGGNIGGMNFDKNGNLFAANLDANTVERFTGGTAGPTTFGTGYHSAPLGLLIDPQGNVFVGQSADDNSLLEFSSAGGSPIATFFPAFDIGGVGYLELLDDGASVLYTSSTQSGVGLGNVKNYDIANSHQNPDFVDTLPNGPAYAIRELPDKSILVANATKIVRVDAVSRLVTQTYSPASGLFFALNLNPDGQSFYTADALTGTIYQVNIASGATMNTITTGLGFNGATLAFSTVFGLAVAGQPQSGGADLAVTMSAPTSDPVNTSITYNITLTNNGPLAVTSAAVTDTLPAGGTFVSSHSSQGTCSGTATVTCALGAIANSGVVTATVVVTPTTAGTLNNTVNVNASTPDPIPGNNSFTTSTTVTGGVQPAAITMSAPSFVQLGAGFTYEIQVSNPGSTTLSGITVTDTLPGSLNATSLTPGCTGTNAVTCTIGTLTAGQVVTLGIAIVPTASPATLTNTANVTGGNSATVSTSVITNGILLVVEDGSTNPADFVTSAPAGVNCTTTQFFCNNYFPGGTTVVLTANGPGFVGWNVDNAGPGTCTGTGTCTVQMTTQHDVSAVYNSPVVWFTSALPGGVVGVPYRIDLNQNVLGGQQPLTFTKTGNLPNGLTLTNNLISGTPTAAGTSSFSLTVTDALQATATISTSITIINPPNTQNALVNGPYGVLFRGVSDADGSLRDFVGSLNFDGHGGITGMLDTNGNGTSPAAQTLTITGTYSVGADNRGLMFLNTAAGKFGTFAFSIGDFHPTSGQNVAFSGRFVRFDDNTGTGTRGAGLMRRQMPSAFTAASFAGPYVFEDTGQNPNLERIVELGLFAVDAAGNFGSGSADINVNGVLGSITSIAGSYSLPISATTGRTTWTLTESGTATSSVVSYIIDANNVVFMALDPGTSSGVIAGTAERQAPGPFSNASLVGPDVVNAQGPSQPSGTSSVFLGILTAGSVGGVPTISVNFDSNDGGNVLVQGTESAPYAIAANGRAMFNFVPPNKPVIAYIVRQDHAFVMGTDTTGSLGEIDLQHGGPFSNATFAGNFFIGDREPASPSGGSVASGVTTNAGSTLSFTVDESHARGTLNYANAGSFGIAVAPSGRVAFTPNPAQPQNTTNQVGYQVSPSRGFVGDIDPTSQHPQVLEAESLTMPPGVVSPTVITATFGTTSVGSPVQLIFNVSNVGDGLLTINSVTNATDFRTTGPCVSSLPGIFVISQGSCPLTINFDPSASSPTGVLLNEVLTLHTDAGDVTINASGTIAGSGSDVSVKVQAPATVAVNGTMPYTITVTNNGPQDATGVTMSDPVPAGLQPTQVSGPTCHVNIQLSVTQYTVVCNIGALANGASSIITFNVSPTAAGTLVNTATVSSTSTDPNQANNSASATTVVGGTPATFSAIVQGSAIGTVTDGNGGQINCMHTRMAPDSCSATYATGSVITLTESTVGNFLGWLGTPNACTVVGNTCQFTMVAGETVTANFVPGATLFPLTVAPSGAQTGSGTLTSLPPVITNCRVTTTTTSGCTANFPVGELVNLTIQADSGSQFVGWTGTSPTCLGSSAVNCLVAITAPENVFVQLISTAQTFVLSVAEAGTGTGTVTSQAGLSPAINCSSGSQTGCSATYNANTSVVLTAVGTNGATFGGWSGGGTPGCSGTGTCSVTMNQIQNVTATFAAPIQQFTLTVADSGTGTGTVTSQAGLAPAIDCKSGSVANCSASYNSGQSVTLTAAADANSTFAGWTGACTNASGTCTVSMTQLQNVTATFNISTGPPTLVSIAVTPSPANVQVDGTVQLTATGTFSDGSTQNLTTTATWTSFDPTLATVNQGLVTGVATAWPVSITAKQGNISGSGLVGVGPVIVASPPFADDKQRIDGKSTPLKVVLTNTSATQTIHFSGTPTTDNAAYTATMNCTTLAPGQTCTVLVTFTSAQVCQSNTNTGANVTVSDDDLGGVPVIFVNAYGADTGLQVKDLTDPTLTATQLAQSLVGPGVTISNVKYTGGPLAAGTFSSTPNIIGFTNGIVLSSGSVRNVVGPNCSSGITAENAQPGDSDLTNLIGVPTNDAAVLEFDFTTTGSAITFQYVFASDEYNEFVGQFNDVFAFFLNGNNIALIPGTNPPAAVSINNVNQNTNSSFFINNDVQFPGVAPVDTEMDGLTVVLTAQAAVTPGKVNHIKLAIADANDFDVDSNVFIQAGSLTSSTVTLTPGSVAFGPQPVDLQSSPVPVTLANTGTTAVAITSIVATAPFGETSTCPAQLAPAGQPGSSCIINVTINPTDAVAFNGTLTVTDNSPTVGSTQVVTLSGTGTGTLVSIAVAPPKATIAVGASQTFTATGTFSDDSTRPVPVTWSSASNTIATIDPNSGVAKGVSGGGPIAITATSTQFPLVAGSAQLTVTAPMLVSIAVTPATPTIVVGQTQQFTATGTFSDNTTQNLTAQVTWGSSNTEAATISEGGLATGVTGGETSTISATVQQGKTSIVGSTLLTVTNVPFILTVIPPAGGSPGAPITVSPGGQLAIGLNLTATPGFNGTVTFSCISNAPQFLTCAPAPATVTLSGNSPKQVAIVMNTFCQGDVPIYGPGPGGFGGGLALLLAAGMLGSITWAYRRRSRWALSFAALLFIALSNAACGGVPAGPNGRTPAGNYTLFITATANGASQTVQVPIQVTN